jgi:hypothetical protein
MRRTKVAGAATALSLAILTSCSHGDLRSRDPQGGPRASAAPHVLRAEARAAYGRGEFATCAGLFAEAAAKAREKPSDAYNAACCLARAGDREGAFAQLGIALDGGLRAVEQLASDADLEALHADLRWPTVLERARGTQEARRLGGNPELERLFQEDQADRRAGPSEIDWNALHRRDTARRGRVGAIIQAGGARTASDFYHAAMVFQHGDTCADFRMAHRLAHTAAVMDPADEQALWLAAAARDRELMKEGKPQLYGTQYRKVDGRWQLYPVDLAVTDEERAEWSVPSLAEARRQAEAMNAAIR